MIVVEGPDGAGKTTLANKIAAEYNLTYVPNEGPFKIRERCYQAVGAAVMGYDPVRVYDRLLLSELVYGDLLRREMCFKMEEIQFLLRILKSMSCPIVICLPPIDTVIRNLADSEQMEGVEENIEKIWNRYRQLLRGEAIKLESIGSFISINSLQFCTRAYDYEKDGDQFHYIDDYLRARSERTWH